MRIYLAGPMSGVPYFNYPQFDAATNALRDQGHDVFNPAERTRERYGTDISVGNATGDEILAGEIHGFDRREDMAENMAWICRHADAIALLPEWEKSRGATAERATAMALGLEVIRL